MEYRRRRERNTRGRMRVLCVALWRTRPCVLFVLEARFSPIDRTPCFNANPHRRSPPFVVFPPLAQIPFPITSLLYVPRWRYWAARLFRQRLPLTPFEKSMFHQSSDMLFAYAAGAIFPTRPFAHSIDPWTAGNRWTDCANDFSNQYHQWRTDKSGA